MALENILSQEIVQKLGWTLLHFVWQATAVALLLGILLALLRKSSANLRYIVTCAALGLIVILSIVTMQLVPVSTPQPPANIEPAPLPAVLTVEPVEQTPLTRALEYMEMTRPENVGTATPVHWKQQACQLLESSLPYLVAGWLLGVFGLSLWHLGGWAQLQRLRKKMVKQVDDSVQNRLLRLSEKLHIRQTVQLLESALVQVPTVVGWLRPVILLPASALTGLSSEQLEALLAHELAHIRRYDYLVNMLQTVVETLGFYHPAVWWISRKIRIERENCCDDLAVSISGDRIRYARALTSMEEIRAGRSELSVAADGGNLFSRIRRLLGKDSTDSSRTSWIPSVITILLIAIIAIPTTLALTGPSESKGDADFERILVDEFRENRDIFKSGVLTWILTEKNEGLSEGPRTETKGMFQLWWDGRKITTKYAQERTDLDADVVIDKRQGGNSYNGKLLSKKPRFDSNENWFGQVINWTGPRAVDQEIPALRKRRNVILNFSTVIVDGKELLKLISKNTDKATADYLAYTLRYFDPSKNYGLVNEEWYTADNRLRLRFSYKLREVIPDGWFPVDVNIKGFSLKDGKVYLERHLALDLERCRFNDPSAIPDGIFDFSAKKEHEQLKDILAKFSDGTSGGKPDNNSKSVRESVQSYIAAALAGYDEKSAEYVYPDTPVATQTNDMREALQGQDIRIVGMCIGEWNALAISSVILADHGRTGSIVFYLKKVMLDQKVHWLINDIDLEAIDSIGNTIKYFLNNVPDAKTIIISADKYANKQTGVPAESGEGRIEGRIIDINTGKGISGVQLSAARDSSTTSNERSACTSAEDGTFAIGGLKSGEYLLRGDFPSVNVDVVSGRSTNDVLIGIDRRTDVAAQKETAAGKLGDVPIIIAMRMIEMPADAMKDVFEPNESLSSGLLIRYGHEIAGRLLALRQEREDVKQMMNPQIEMMNNTNATILTTEEKTYISSYESTEGEPGNLTAQHKTLKAGWKYNIKAEIFDSGEKIRIELAARQQKPVFETLQYHPGYDYQIPARPEIFVTKLTAKNGEPVSIGWLKRDETAICLILTPSVKVPERQPEPLMGKRLPEPENIRNIDNLKQAQGKPTLICFWDMNQRPSRNLIVELGKRQNKLTAKDIAVCLIHTSNIKPAKLKEWLDNQNVQFVCGNIENDAKEVLIRWGVRAQPWLILTNEKGIVRAEGFSLDQLDEKIRVEKSMANSSSVPLLEKSDEPPGVDKPIVKVDLSVVEVFPDAKMDTETKIAIENLLGSKITIPDSPAVADLLRKAAKATAAVKDESAGDKRVTQEQFNKLFDTLVSRGFVKILMRPTLEVVDGQTATIRSMQDSLADLIQITPNVSKDSKIILLQVEAALSSQTIPEDDEQTPIINKLEISTQIRLSPGDSGIIGGTKQAGIITKPGKDAKDIEEPATEILVILTPTIVTIPGNQQDGSDIKKDATFDKEYEVIQLSQIDPVKAVNRLKKAMQQTPESQKSVLIQPLEQTRQIIIFGKPDMRQMVKKLLAEIDVPAPAAEEPEQSDQPKSSISQILIDTKILTASDEFLKDIGIDPTSPASSEGWSDYLVYSSGDSAGFVIDQLHTDLISNAFAARTRTNGDIQILHKPQVLAQSGKKFEIHILKQDYYTLTVPTEPNTVSEQPEPELKRMKLGTTVRLTPTLTTDGLNVELDFEWEHRRLRGVKEHTGPDGIVQKVPQIDVDSIKTPCTIPDGKTLFVTGRKINYEFKSESRTPILSELPAVGGLFRSSSKVTKTRTLLILITPSTVIKNPPIPQPIAPNDPLIKKLG